MINVKAHKQIRRKQACAAQRMNARGRKKNGRGNLGTARNRRKRKPGATDLRGGETHARVDAMRRECLLEKPRTAPVVSHASLHHSFLRSSATPSLRLVPSPNKKFAGGSFYRFARFDPCAPVQPLAPHGTLQLLFFVFAQQLSWIIAGVAARVKAAKIVEKGMAEGNRWPGKG